MKTISAAEYREKYLIPKSKMRNVKTEVDGITFDSRLEANRYCELKLLKQTGAIRWFGRQPSFVLDESNRRYRPDFIVCDTNGNIWVEDCKGYATDTFKSKKRQWDKVYPGLPLVEVKRR